MAESTRDVAAKVLREAFNTGHDPTSPDFPQLEEVHRHDGHRFHSGCWLCAGDVDELVPHVVDALAEAGLLHASSEPLDDEAELLPVYEREREELAAGIVKAVQGQYIGKPPPLLTGWQERAVSAVLAAGWLPPAAVQERVDDVLAENERLRAEIARLQDAAANALANQTALKGMTVDEGALVLELGPPRELVIAWVDAARKMLGGAENYSETRIDFPRESASMEVKAAGEFERYVFTVQRAGKITPHEARRAAEAERDEMLTHYSRALDEVYRLRKAMAYEATLLDANLRWKSLPSTARHAMDRQAQRLFRAARGEAEQAYAVVDARALREALLDVGAEEGLSRGQWEASDA